MTHKALRVIAQTGLLLVVDALAPRPVSLPWLPAPLLPPDVVAVLRGAAGLPDAPPPPAPVESDDDVAGDDDEDEPLLAQPVVPPGAHGQHAPRSDNGEEENEEFVDDTARRDGGSGVDDDAGILIARTTYEHTDPGRAPDAGAFVDGDARVLSGVPGDAGTIVAAAGAEDAVVISRSVVDAGIPVDAARAGGAAVIARSVVDAGAAAAARFDRRSETFVDAGSMPLSADAGGAVDAGNASDAGDAGDAGDAVVVAPASVAGDERTSSDTARAPASSRRPEGPPGFEVPEDGATWSVFLDKIRSVKTTARGKVRIVQLGDSEIAGDRFVSTLRADVAARIGHGGPGFALASPPWHWYRRAGFDSLSSQGFRTRSFVKAQGNAGNFGPGGVAFDAVEAGARVDARLEAGLGGAGCTIEFVYATQPAGGALRLSVDDTEAGILDLAGDEGVAVWRHTAATCPRRLSAAVLRPPARVFGWSVEASRGGVVWSSLGTVGANASALSRYAPGRLGEALALLQPDLVVATYGLNLTGHDAKVPRSEGEQLQRVMAELRARRPDTACLVMSPYPVLVDVDGTLTPSTSTRRLAAVQRRAARAAGCVFLEREQLVGGPDVALEWLNRKPRYLSGDYVHLTPEGASFVSRTVSRLLLTALFGGSDAKEPR